MMMGLLIIGLNICFNFEIFSFFSMEMEGQNGQHKFLGVCLDCWTLFYIYIYIYIFFVCCNYFKYDFT